MFSLLTFVPSFSFCGLLLAHVSSAPQCSFTYLCPAFQHVLTYLAEYVAQLGFKQVLMTEHAEDIELQENNVWQSGRI